MAEESLEERIDIKFRKPKYPIGQEIFIPKPNRVLKTKVSAYRAFIIPDFDGDDDLVGNVLEYEFPMWTMLRRADHGEIITSVREEDFYLTEEKAQEACRFLEVKLEDDMWRLILGDWDLKDYQSHFHKDNRYFGGCCGNLDQAHSILIYCRDQEGLMVHDRNQFVEIVTEHNDGITAEGPLIQLYDLLEIEYTKFENLPVVINN